MASMNCLILAQTILTFSLLIQTSIAVNVEVPATASEDPEIELSVWMVVAKENAPFDLTCNIEDQSADIKWDRIEGDLPSGTNASARVLHFSKVSQNDAGFYECHLATETEAATQFVTQLIVEPDQSLRTESSHTKKVKFQKVNATVGNRTEVELRLADSELVAL